MDLMDTLPAGTGETLYEGLIKFKLAHALGFSAFLPDALFIEEAGWKWFQPQFFTACSLAFHSESGYAQFGFELNEHTRLLVGLTKERFVRCYSDESHLYRCRIAGPPNLPNLATGRCFVDADHDIRLELYHHTSSAARSAILDSEYFLASAWNIQGNKKLENVAYVYFTTLPKVESDEDLKRIAMASDGRIHLLPTNGVPPQDLVEIEVYRESTPNRTATLLMEVPVETIASQHVRLHRPVGNPAYYEVSHPAIQRVGLHPGRRLPFHGSRVDPDSGSLRHFDYVVLGDADEHAGLVAPYDEEHTPAVFKIEPCTTNLFDYWEAHANTDQFSNRIVERQTFEPP